MGASASRRLTLLLPQSVPLGQRARLTIVGSRAPSYAEVKGRSFDHIGDIVRAAAVEEPIRWPFVLDVIEKRGPTERFAGKTWRQRREIAEVPLRDALYLPSPDVVSGCSVLVLDDVFTEGFTIREIARALTIAGAEEVSEIVLAREPWTG